MEGRSRKPGFTSLDRDRIAGRYVDVSVIQDRAGFLLAGNEQSGAVKLSEIAMARAEVME